MAGAGKANGKLAKNLIKYSVRYGPFVIEAVKHGREPAQQAVQAAWAKLSARRKGTEHALTVREGSLLKVIKDGEVIFFVFSGDAIVTTYPQVPQSAYPELLRHSDLDQRVTADVLADRKPKRVPHLPKIRRR
jgi:hypothetical protein